MCRTKDQGGRRCEGALARQRDSNAFSRAEKVFEETGKVSLGFVSSKKSLDEAVANGSIVARQHKDFPELTVYDYSATTHFARGWTDLTTECRGLIINTETNEIVARPFKKFYNNEEDDVPDNQFPRTGRIEVMEKMDGCFLRETRVNLWGGGTMKIGDIVDKRIPAVLVGMDDSGKLVPSKVTNWFNNGAKDHWMSIEVDTPVSYKSGSGGHPNKIKTTVNHHFYVNGEYKPAVEVKEGDSLVSYARSISSSGMKMIQDSLLGDGALVLTANGKGIYQESHSEKQREYVEYLRKSLGNALINSANTISGYGSTMMWTQSIQTEALGDMKRLWYPSGAKEIPDDLSWMDNQSVAKWVMDDGSRGINRTGNPQKDRLMLATNGFSIPDIERLAEKLRSMYGVSVSFSEDRRGKGTALRVNAGRDNSIQFLWKSIAPYIHPSLLYKIPEEYHDVEFIPYETATEEMAKKESIVQSVKLLENTKKNFPFGRVGFDIETETHNYMVKGILVHNSMGILFQRPDGKMGVSTRGSMNSEQAEHATALYNEKYEGTWNPDPDYTYCFEVIYPDNRIVVDYGNQDDLVLLGARHKKTGASATREQLEASGWTGPTPKIHQYDNFSDVIKAQKEGIKGEEGFVVHFVDHDKRVKMKFSEYLSLHRAVSDMSPLRVYEQMRAGTPLSQNPDFPDEFFDDVKKAETKLNNQYQAQYDLITKEHKRIRSSLPEGYTVKDFAIAAKESKMEGISGKPLSFLMSKEKEQEDRLKDSIWDAIKPKGNLSFTSFLSK